MSRASSNTVPESGWTHLDSDMHQTASKWSGSTLGVELSVELEPSLEGVGVERPHIRMRV